VVVRLRALVQSTDAASVKDFLIRSASVSDNLVLEKTDITLAAVIVLPNAKPRAKNKT
jgi:hypothetical protein